MPRTRNPGADVLRRLYVEQGLSTRQVGTQLGVTATTVRDWLSACGIPTRTISDAKRGQKPATHAVMASVNARRTRQLPGRGPVGYKLRADGYISILMPHHPIATKEGYVLEHRLVMSERIGRPLRAHEDVHHINGDRTDNRPDNLELLTHSEHLREHYYERSICPDTGQFLPG